MKKLLTAILAAAVAAASFYGCSQDGTPLDIQNPDSATEDEILPALNENSIEPSPNVNGMRFTMTIEEFTESYNEFKRANGENDLIMMGNWKQIDEESSDNKGVRVKYYYYDDENISFTATVEAENDKLVNIGCGTTMSKFMAQNESGESNSEAVLYKAAVMAKTVCRFPKGSERVMQNIFYRTTTENLDSLWYQGFIFSLSTQEDKTDSKNSVMLFRVFPISDELRDDWNPEYFNPD